MKEGFWIIEYKNTLILTKIYKEGDKYWGDDIRILNGGPEPVTRHWAVEGIILSDGLRLVLYSKTIEGLEEKAPQYFI